MLRLSPVPFTTIFRHRSISRFMTCFVPFLNPFADVGRTILQLDLARFAACKKSNCFPIHKSYLFQVKRQVCGICFCIEKRLQFRQILFLYPTLRSKITSPSSSDLLILSKLAGYTAARWPYASD